MGRVGVYSRAIRLVGGKVASINLGYNNCTEHKRDSDSCIELVKCLWYEANTCASLDPNNPAVDPLKLHRVQKRNEKLASMYRDSLFGNFLVPASVYTYSHKICINNSKNRAKGLRCILQDGNYTVLSVGIYGLTTDKWEYLVGNRKTVGEEHFFNMAEYQGIAESEYSDVAVVRDFDTTYGDVSLAGVWSLNEPCFYILCNNDDYMKQLRDAIQRGVVAIHANTIGIYSPMGNGLEGLTILVLDALQGIL